MDGWRANSAAQRKQFNVVLTSQLQENTRLKIVANMFDMPHAQDPLGLTAAQLAADRQQAGSNALARNTRKYVQHQQLGSVLEHRFNSDLQIQLRAYSGTRENLQYLANAAWIGLNRDFSGLGLQFQGRQRASAGGQVQWVLGLDVDKSAERRQAGDTLNGQQIGDFTRNELNRASNRDVYAQANWQLDPNVVPLTLTAGLRQSEVELRSRDDYFADGYDGSGNVKYRASNPVLGVTWHAAETLNVYANWGKGFETPTLAEAAYAVNTNNSVLGRFNPMLLAARSQHKEMGLKWMPTPKTRLQAALFHIGNNDEIVVLKSSFGQTAYKNASATNRQGAELAWAQLWTPHWSSQLSASWLQATYEKSFSSIIAGNVVSIPAGNRLPGIPDKQLFASIQWAQNGFSGKRGPLGWSSSLDWIARSALWANDMNDEASRAPGYGVLNARLRHRSDWGKSRLEAWLGIDNLGNRSAVGSVIVNQSSAQYFEPNLPRQWVLGIKLINML
jgi:iron complex outermembrane receptor protein